MTAPQASEASSRPRKATEPQPHSGALTRARATRPTAYQADGDREQPGAGQVRPARRGFVCALRDDPAGQQDGDQSDRQVDPEHPPPAELHQAPADHRPERGAESADRGPGTDGPRPGLGRHGGKQQRQRGRHHQAGSGRLDHPGGDQRGHPWRQTAAQRADAEGDQSGHEEAAAPDPVGPPAGRHKHRGEHNGVAVEHPGQRPKAGPAVLDADIWEGQVDDEEIEAGHEYGQRQNADDGRHLPGGRSSVRCDGH